MDKPYDLTAKRPQKDIARTLAVKKHGKVAKVALFLTIPSIPDIKQALKTKTISKQTKIIVAHFEKKASVATNHRNCEAIKSDLRRAGFRDFLVVCDYLEKSFGEIKTYLGRSKINYAFIDLCGEITSSVALMLHNLQDFFAEKARIGFTVAVNGRSYNNLAEYRRVFDGHLPVEATAILQSPHMGEWMSGMFGYVKIDAQGYYTTREKARMMSVNVVGNFLWQFAAVTSVMNNRKIDLMDAIMYRDETNMGFVQFVLGEKESRENAASRLEPMEHVLKVASIRKSKSRSESRSESALKAWVTRRNNLFGITSRDVA